MTEIQQTGCQYLPKLTTASPNQELLPLSAQVQNQDYLSIGGCDIKELVNQFGSPLYILDEYTLRTACRQYKTNLEKYYPAQSQVLYASKAWNTLAICAIVHSEGLGIDVVSGGELYTAIEAGIRSDKIYLHGNNKSKSELELAINSNCTIIVDNWYELKYLAQINHFHPIRIMIRLTPGIECHTHEYIKTGQIDTKFGFTSEDISLVFNYIKESNNLNCIGLHAHIGSQIFELAPHQDLPNILVTWFKTGLEQGLPLTELNIGGGLGIRYIESDDPPSIEDWVKTISQSVVQSCHDQGVALPKLLCEPGRSIIGPACVTAYTIGSSKNIPGYSNYIAIDGGMSDNPRPITYQSQYRTIIANKMSQPLTEQVVIAGKHCESGDILIKGATLPSIVPGDILVVMGTGAYNYSMASNYNRIPRLAAVLVNEGEANLIIQRESYQDLLRLDRLPHRLLDLINN